MNSNGNNFIKVPSHLEGLTIDILTETTIIGIVFTNRGAFNQWITTPFLEIKLSCGCYKIYQDRCDVPRESVQCEHGNYYIRIGKHNDF